MDNAVVGVKSAWASKINWTQAVALLAMVLAVFGIDMPPDTKVAIVALIQAVQSIASWIIKTWFTTTVTPSSAKKV